MPVISRAHVHALSEACADQGQKFQGTAQRLLKDQDRLTRFFRSNLPVMDNMSGEVSLYLLAVIIRIFEQTGRVRPVKEKDIQSATARILAHPGLLPGDAGFPARVRAIAARAQPHVLDEALEALFERAERKEGEVDIPASQAALVFVMLWAATEALQSAWTPPTHPDWADA